MSAAVRNTKRSKRNAQNKKLLEMAIMLLRPVAQPLATGSSSCRLLEADVRSRCNLLGRDSAPVRNAMVVF
jgi:hypothetical protein